MAGAWPRIARGDGGRARESGGTPQLLTVNRMTSEQFKVRLLRAAHVGDRVALRGSVVNAPAIDAAALIRSGHAVLVDLADLGPLLDALPASANLLPRAVLAR